MGKARRRDAPGNDLFKGDMPGFLATLTAEHFPALEALDMSCECRAWG